MFPDNKDPLYEGDRFVPFTEDPLRQYASTGAVKDNLGKPPIDLMSSKAIIAIAEVMGYGARKYKPHNWRLGLSWSQTYASMQRHLLAWNDGQDIDPESGLPHLAHAGCQLMYLLEYAQTGTGEDDRFSSVDQSQASLAGVASDPKYAVSPIMGVSHAGRPIHTDTKDSE